MIKEKILKRVEQGDVKVHIEDLQIAFYDSNPDRNLQSMTLMFAGHTPTSRVNFSFEKTKEWAEGNGLMIVQDINNPDYLIFAKKKRPQF